MTVCFAWLVLPGEYNDHLQCEQSQDVDANLERSNSWSAMPVTYLVILAARKRRAHRPVILLPVGANEDNSRKDCIPVRVCSNFNAYDLLILKLLPDAYHDDMHVYAGPKRKRSSEFFKFSIHFQFFIKGLCVCITT